MVWTIKNTMVFEGGERGLVAAGEKGTKKGKIASRFVNS